MKDEYVVVVGSLNYDFMLKVDRMPDEGETMFAKNIEFCRGGKGANQAVQSSKLGLRTIMVGSVGQDYMGDNLLEGLQTDGVEIDYIRRSTENTGIGIVHSLEDGKVYATISKGANFSITTEYINEISNLIKHAKLVILQLEIPTEVVEQVIRIAKEAGSIILFNTAPAVNVSIEALKSCDWIVMNENEASYYINKTISTLEDAKMFLPKFSEKLGNNCIITLGEKGSLFCGSGEMFYQEVYKTQVVETTGAGDSFMGGLAYGILNGYSIKECLKFATCCSSITIEKIGAQSAMPFLSQVTERFKMD